MKEGQRVCGDLGGGEVEGLLGGNTLLCHLQHLSRSGHGLVTKRRVRGTWEWIDLECAY